jgi:pyruvate dehydrogenase kinase 2/3/4
MSPRDVVRDAIDDARSICMRQYGDAPEVEVFGGENFTFAYVPGHLHQMLFELVKNSLRAVSEKYAESLDNPPPIRVVIAEGAEDVTIKISDEGGGIRRSGLQRIWTYLYTTADSPLLDMDGDSASAGGPVVLAGYGYGLPLSRLYARYFGGDLQVISMDGYGTDAYLHLNRLGNVQEPLP